MTSEALDAIKRYRVFGTEFDARAQLLGTEIDPDWEPHIREQWESNIASVRSGLEQQFGSFNLKAKIKNFTEFGSLPFSVVAYHNRFLRQIRDSFTIGAYYSALTGASALGERILNHLVLCLRDDHRSSPHYKKVYDKESFHDWSFMITVLEDWDVLLPEASTALRRLGDIRNREAVHFSPGIDADDRTPALRVGRLICEIVGSQFAAHGGRPWYIRGTPGVTFVRQEAEARPFVREFILPSCLLVGPLHKVIEVVPNLKVEDPSADFQRAITDEEFVEAWKGAQSTGE
ncbi:MAG: hypothetical protein WEF28_04835 [Acidimicrobiia bacterium]